MTWPFVLLLIFGCLVILMLTGMPIFFAFMFICLTGSIIYWGGLGGIEPLASSVFSSVSSFVILPVPLFILMGNIIFEAGVGVLIVEALDKIIGRLPGRLSLLAMGAGTLLGSMVGISGASIAILGRSLVPEMSRRGYQKPMSLGPIVATGVLATMIPPSAMAVFLGAIGQVSIGKLLIAIIMPGLLLAILFSTYIVIRCLLQPSIAPSYTVAQVSFAEKARSILYYILPTGIVIFAALGSIFLGIATPSEAAALGAIACYILAALYKKLNWQVIKKSAMATIQITVMVLMIMTASVSFGRILAFSGAVAGLTEFTTSLALPPIVIIILTQIVVLILGCFMDPASIVMITAPIFMPIVSALGYNTVWYSVILLIDLQLGLITPPFGLDAYTMKALAPPGVTLGDVFRSTTPFLCLGLLGVVLIIIFPSIALWLPSVAR
jgi:tripartite ATP-independent transporter DctM subunit